ncbi:MAG: hypothetical protein N2C14_29125 [Planctomycetales bacterium]
MIQATAGRISPSHLPQQAKADRLRASGVAACWILLAAAFPSAVAAQTTLAWKLEPKQQFFVDTRVERTQNSELVRKQTSKERRQQQREKRDDELKQRTIVKVDVLSKSPTGDVKLKQTIVHVENRDNEEAESLRERLIGAEFLVTYDKNMEITKLEGRDKFVESLASGNPAAERAMGAMLTDDVVKAIVGQAFGMLPGKPVNAEDEWSRTVVQGLGSLGELHVKRDFTYVGTNSEAGKTYHDVTFEGDGEWKQSSKPGADSPLKITKADVKFVKWEGFLQFDAKAGRLFQMEMESEIHSDLTLKLQGAEADIHVVTKETTSVRVTRFDPSK